MDLLSLQTAQSVNTGLTLIASLFFCSFSGDAVSNAGYNIGVEFLINSHSLSGLKVAKLKLFNESYEPYKAVRTMTKAGRYQVRA